MALGRNIIANYVGRGWGSLLSLLLIPLYIQFLGMEAYGLVGTFAVITNILGILDLGIGATLNRELARLSTVPGSAREQRDLVRTLETLYWGVAVVAGAVVVGLAPALTAHWIHEAQDLPRSTVVTALRLMGLALALQFPSALYQGGLMGLQRQVLVNGILVAAGTLRGVGAALVLWLVSPTIEAFFAWQVLASLVATGSSLAALWRSVPRWTEAARFRVGLFRGIWKYAASMSANSMIGVVLTQLDKAILIPMLTLKAYGYYSLASQVASSIWSIIVPFNAAVFPRLVQLHESRSDAALRALFHRASQLLSAILVPVCAVLIVFSGEIFLLWTRNPQVAGNCHLIVSLLVLGTMLNGMVSVPGYAAAAFGWPQLITYTNLIQAVVIVPLLVTLVLWLQGVGAAIAWVALNSTYVVFMVPWFFRRHLREERGEWYLRDQVIPAAVAFSVCFGSWVVTPASLGPAGRLGQLAATGLIAALATAFSLRHVRELALQYWRARRSRG
jgi:O-antigen/teichoic acid export membrane protein